MQADKMKKAMSLLKEAMACLEGSDMPEKEDKEELDAEVSEDKPASSGLDEGRSMLRQRLGKLA